MSKSICKIEGCSNTVNSYGYCQNHYTKLTRHGDALFPLRQRHGLSKMSEWQSWFHLRQRCNNANNDAYKLYGGRGISVCPEWENDFLQFLADMGEKPSVEMFIDRIDCNGNYEPSNCRWVNKVDSGRNRRGVVFNKHLVSVARDMRNRGFQYKHIGYILDINKDTVRSAVNGKSWR